MDPTQGAFNESVSTLIERKIRGWLAGVLEDMRRRSPVQQWLDSIPAEESSKPGETSDLSDECKSKANEEKTDLISEDTLCEDKTEISTTVKENNAEIKLDVPSTKEVWKRKSLEGGVLLQSKTKNKLQRDCSIQSEGYSTRIKNPLFRDCSLQSDASGSSGSSVSNVLDARKVDAESVLLALGFAPSEKQQKLQRIPDRFLVPSKLKGINTEMFIKGEHHSMRMHDCGVFGYRGLTGNPHAPPSTIVAKIMECILQDDECRSQSLQARHSVADIRSAAQAHARYT